MTAETKKKVAAVLGNKPPRLNERVLIDSYQSYQYGDMIAAAETIEKCGLVAEITKTPGKIPVLFAARRRGRTARG